MIRSWADLEAFLANGGRLRFEPQGDRDAWSDAESGAHVVTVLATRAVADGKAVKVSDDGDGIIYAGRAA